MKLLTIGDASPKLAKSDKAGLGYKSAVMYLLPHDLSGHNVCPFASAGCKATCLNWAGRGQMNSVQNARLKKTEMFFNDREGFKKQLASEIKTFSTKVEKSGFKTAIRLNGLSDLPVEKMFANLIQDNPNIQFYDYTKNPKRYQNFLDGKLPKNYYLTFSRSENNEKECLDFLSQGGNVAVVFRTPNFPSDWNGFTIYDGDKHDLRFLDKSGVCGLKAKGKATKDKTGFVHD